MRFFLPVLAVLIILTVARSARARIGETEAEIVARYGESKKDAAGYKGHSRITPASIQLFAKDGITIQVAFADGKSVAEAYWKTNGMELSGAEQGALLVANQGQSAWSSSNPAGSRMDYTRDDHAETGTYDHNTQVLDLRAEKTPIKPLSGF